MRALVLMEPGRPQGRYIVSCGDRRRGYVERHHFPGSQRAERSSRNCLRAAVRPGGKCSPSCRRNSQRTPRLYGEAKLMPRLLAPPRPASGPNRHKPAFSPAESRGIYPRRAVRRSQHRVNAEHLLVPPPAALASATTAILSALWWMVIIPDADNKSAPSKARSPADGADMPWKRMILNACHALAFARRDAHWSVDVPPSPCGKRMEGIIYVLWIVPTGTSMACNSAVRPPPKRSGYLDPAQFCGMSMELPSQLAGHRCGRAPFTTVARRRTNPTRLAAFCRARAMLASRASAAESQAEFAVLIMMVPAQ